MSETYNLELTGNTIDQIIYGLEEATCHAESFGEIQELVHLIDNINDAFDEDVARKNKDWAVYSKYRQLLDNHEKPEDPRFYHVLKILESYGLESDTPNGIYYCIAHILEYFDGAKDE